MADDEVPANLAADKFPMTLKLYSGKTGEVVWSRTITLDEARGLAKIDVPSFARSEHYPVRAEVELADGTISIGGMS